MIYVILTGLVVSLHLSFIVYAVLGGLLALRWPRAAWLHLLAAGWATAVEFFGWPCPLTPLEKWFRSEAGLAGYGTGFVEHYLLPLIYPAGLTRDLQLELGLLVLTVNIVIYAWVWRCRRSRVRRLC